MMGQVATINAGLPAVFQGTVEGVFDEFSQGVTSGFPVISFRGGVWRVKQGGEEQVHVDESGDAIPSIQVVLVRSNPLLAKSYYEKSYEEGDTGSPRCWSTNGITPDTSVERPMHPRCDSCAMNAWGSKITPTGKKTRACADVRRLAVVFMHDLEEHLDDDKHEVPVLLLRVPPASLNPLKDYIEKVLQPKSVPPYALSTKVGFDTTASFPKLTFKGSQFLNQEQGEIVMALRESPEVKHILQETEYSSEGTTGTSEVGAPAATGVTETPAAPSESTLQPAQEEELHAGEPDAIAPAAPATNGGEAPAPAAPAKKKRRKKAATPAEPPVAAAEPPVPVAPAGEAVEDDFDKMLNSLLKDD
jgi:hypothetical protein